MKKSIFILSLSFCLIICMFISFKNIGMVSAKTFDNTNCKSYIVIDDMGNILLEKNSNKKYEVASICKLMTTLITLENIKKGNISLDDKMYTSIKASEIEGSQAFLDAGSEYSVRDLLKSVIVASANDSAIVLAEGIAGDEASFVDLMNQKCKELNMNNTRYSNSTGLPSFEQYSTAFDTSIILNEVSKYDIYREDCKIWMDKLVHPSGRVTELVNTNRLIKYYDYCETGKTGFTDEAGYCLSSTANKDGFKLTCVVLGCDKSVDRFKESMSLYDYVYSNYRKNLIIEKNKLIPNQVLIKKGKKDDLKLVYENDFSVTQKNENKSNCKIELNLKNEIKAPVKKGDIVGEAIIILNDDVIGKVNIISLENIDKEKYKDALNKVIKKFNIF